MTLIYLFLALSLLCCRCDAQSTDLPANAPAEVSFTYYQGGGMSRSYRKYAIENGTLIYEELQNRQTPRSSWSAKLDPSEIAELYKAFRSNAFDRIENDERDGIVHDAGSESIAISLGAGKMYRVTYGHNSPLSGSNLRRYSAVKKALEALAAKHRKTGDTKMPGTDLEGTWRAAGDHGNGHTWYLQWRFAGGEFEMRGYPPILQKGRYRIAEQSEGKLKLVLFDQSGNFGAEDRAIDVAFGSDGQVMIDRMAGFRRIEN